MNIINERKMVDLLGVGQGGRVRSPIFQVLEPVENLKVDIASFFSSENQESGYSFIFFLNSSVVYSTWYLVSEDFTSKMTYSENFKIISHPYIEKHQFQSRREAPPGGPSST